MSICRWCSPTGDSAAELLQQYCVGVLSDDEKQALEEDLNVCMDCLVEYHRVRKDSPQLHKVLWQLETGRLLSHFSSISKEELGNDEEQEYEDDVCFVENGQEFKVPKNTGTMTPADYTHKLRLSMTEILMYPYLLGHVELSELCVQALSVMERWNTFQVLEKHPGIYLLLVHPNETVRKWAIKAARSLGTVDIEDFYDLKDIFSCMFLMIELGISETVWDDLNPTAPWRGLPPHLYDSCNHKAYWLGICLLVTLLDSHTMDVIFSGPYVMANVPQCIVNTLKDSAEEEEKQGNQCSFWPALQCLTVLLDCMGSRIWAQIEPDMAFSAVTERPCYIEELETIERETKFFVKAEPNEEEDDDEDDNMVTCSQMVYDYKTTHGKEKKTRGVRTADGVVVYEEMRSLVKVLQSDVGQAMRVHNSTFLWFIPYVKSIMQPEFISHINCTIEYICEKIHSQSASNAKSYSKVTEFFTFILINIVDVHCNNDCINLISFSSFAWLRVLIQSATLPVQAFQGVDGQTTSLVSSSSSRFPGPGHMGFATAAVPQACMLIIRALLRMANERSSDTKCSEFLNLLNQHFRGPQTQWNLSERKKQELKYCLQSYVSKTPNVFSREVESTNSPAHLSCDPFGPEPKIDIQPELRCPSVPRRPFSPDELHVGQFMPETGRVSPEDDCRTDCEDRSCATDQWKSVKKEETEMPIFSVSKDVNLDTQSLGGESEDMDDVPLSDLKNRLKGFKVKSEVSLGKKRPCTPPPDFIVISDTDDEEEEQALETEENVLKWEMGKTGQDGTSYADEGDEESEKIKNESRMLEFETRDFDQDMSESQLFEFETQENVVSVWDDLRQENNNLSVTTRRGSPVRQAYGKPSSSDICETQPISAENLESALQVAQKAEEDVEMQKSHKGPKKVTVQKKTELLLQPLPLPDRHRGKMALKKDKKMKHAADATPQFSKPPSPKKDSKKRKSRSEDCATPSTSAGSGTPAIVPPKKVRKAAEPLSTAVKLGLKKKERKAFDLSQRSLDIVGQLRRYGQDLQVEPKQKQKRRNKKPQTSHQNIISVGTKSKLLHNQQLQYLKQSSTKQSAAVTSAHITEHGDRGAHKVSTRNAHDLDQEEGDDDDDDEDPLPCSQPEPARGDYQTSLDRSSGSYVISSDVDKVAHSRLCEDALPSTSAQASNQMEEEYENWMCYTQNEPTDMELCSQMEEMEEDFLHTQRDPVDMDISDSEMLQDGETEPCGQMIPMKANKEQGIENMDHPSRTSAHGNNDDHLFVKPGVFAMVGKQARPSTTKIFAASSSRNDSLVKEMAKTADSSGRARSSRQTLPVQKLTAPQLSTTVTPAQTESILMPPPPNPPQSKPQPPNVLQARNSSTVKPPPRIQPAPHVPQSLKPYKPCAKPAISVAKPTSAGDISSQSLPPRETSIQPDPSIPIHHILKWSYDDFHSGRPPSEALRQIPQQKVGLYFRSFDEYYKTFYPLLLLNTFEELYRDWIKNNEAKSVITQQLKVIDYGWTSGMSSTRFDVNISAYEESHQRHPKEDDLVILWLPQNAAAYSDNGAEWLEPTAHFGYVHKSSTLSRGDSILLSLTIKTYGNVTSIKTQTVRCQVVGCLISALREFKALYMLKNSAMKRPILAPHISFFQTNQNDSVRPDLSGYNKNQSAAIRCGVAAVKNPGNTMKMCVIFGPPGTGKSRTIVGLVEQLFSEQINNRTAGPLTRQPAGRHVRILLCAPSNAALDHLMKKIILNLKDKWKSNGSNPQGNCGNLNLVRLGNEKSMDEKIKGFSLDYQTKRKTERLISSEPQLSRRRMELDEQIEKVSRKCVALKKQTKEYMEMSNQKCALLREREALSKELKQTRGQRQEIQGKVLQEAHIIFCTLNTSGSFLLDSAFRRLGHDPFSCIIVDEASQATETETLIPLVHRSKALILVGDPEQLAPTLMSQTAQELNYGQSLMARLYKYCKSAMNPNPVVFLSQQYRMHPDICDFPSKYIYNKVLHTDPSTAEKRCAVSWPFQSYRLFDVKDGHEVRDGDSFTNRKEVSLLMVLLKLMAAKQQVEVGIITPYNAQKDLIKRQLRMNALTAEVDTVDGFQGREMDCIMVSCVRANHGNGIGFLKSRQRLNVTITRAKCSLFILGHMRTLKTDKDWKALITDAGNRGTIIETDESKFEVNGRQILKPDGFSRNLSHPPRETEPPLAQNQPAHITHRRSSAPASSSGQTRGSSPHLQPSHASPPQGAASRPTDPRLVARVAQPTQAPRVDPTTDPRWDPRVHTARDSRAQRHKHPHREGGSDPRVESSRDPYTHQSRRPDQSRDQARDQSRDQARDQSRDRERHASAEDSRYQSHSRHQPR